MAKNIESVDYCYCFEPGDGACMLKTLVQNILDHPRHPKVLNSLNLQMPDGRVVGVDYLTSLRNSKAPHARVSRREGVPPLCEFKDKCRGDGKKIAAAQHSNGCVTDAALISLLRERLHI